jgi:hypothetical protein
MDTSATPFRSGTEPYEADARRITQICQDASRRRVFLVAFWLCGSIAIVACHAYLVGYSQKLPSEALSYLCLALLVGSFCAAIRARLTFLSDARDARASPASLAARVPVLTRPRLLSQSPRVPIYFEGRDPS